MKTRLAMFLTLILSSASLVMLSGTPAQAATYSATVSQRYPMTGEVVRITGAINPAGRALTLQRYVGRKWVRVSSTRTVSYGRYAFSVRALSTAYSYRSYAPTVRIKKRTYRAAYSRVVRISSVKPSLSFGVSNAPVGQSQSGATDLTPAVATFRPARPNALVVVQRLVGTTWTSVASGRQSSSGTAYVQVPTGTTFRAYARPSTSVPATYSTAVTPSRLTLQPALGDEFSAATLDTAKWYYRVQPAQGKRLCSTPGSAADNLITLGSGVATLKIKKVAQPTSACRYGTFKNAMIGTNDTVGPYGTYAARVKFQSARGMHGSFWLQGPAVTGAEIDVAEYFGDGRIDSGLSSFVHYTDSANRLSTTGGIRNIASILGARRTPSNGWHVYSVQWTPTSYIFRIDGTPVLTTTAHVATAPEEMILSLLSSDYELPHLKTTSTSMLVDWVRVWK